MREDPRMMRVDGVYVCAVCGEALNEIAISNNDPFCKTTHANEWHGFEPLSMRYTLSGHAAGYRPPGVSRWDDGERHRRRRANERVG